MKLTNRVVIKIKVIILAAGYATRLYPLTLNQPKALLDVKGKPILEHIINRVKELEAVDQIYIVTNQKFFKNFNNWLNNFKCEIPIKLLNDKTTSNEDRLGQIVDITFVLNKKKINDDLLIIAGDNLFNFSLKRAYNFFINKKLNVNALYDAKSLKVAKEQGNASIDKDNLIINFEEKPEKPKSTYISLGIYLFPKENVQLLSQYIKEGNNPDKMGYFMIWLTDKKNIHGFVYEDKWFDIGWQESLEQARKEFIP